MAVAAMADAPDPLPPPSASMVGRTLTIEGQWAWTTHSTDCNSDRYAVGYAVAWNDASDPASSGAVSTNIVQNTSAGITAYVGTSTDDAVHWVHKAGEANPNGDPVGATRCGTFDAANGYNSGHWGPITHTYGGDQTDFHVCVVTYDVHNGSVVDGVQQPNSKDLLAGGPNRADDNSIEKNGSTPEGNQCFDIAIPSIATQTSHATVVAGSPVSDTATLGNLSQNGAPTGTVTFELYSSLNADAVNHCGTKVAGFSSTKPVALVGADYEATSDSISTLPVGTYYWLAKYNGDDPSDPTKVHNAAVSGLCGDANESFSVTPAPTGALTLVKHVDKATAGYGNTLTYTFDAGTTGTLDETDAVVHDTLPKGTAYVSGSAKCTDVGPCTASFNNSTKIVTWALGDMPAGTIRHLVFKVSIVTPAFDPTVGLPPETILNAGTIRSTETPSTPSNQVVTKIVTVLGVKVVRKPPTLAFTGAPVRQMLLLGLGMLGVGIALTAVRRRREQ
jgi:uncharacterized repeat protein (TIGR01451 family)